MPEQPTTIAAALKIRFGEDFDVPSDLAGGSVLGSLAAHRTRRKYTDKPVEEGLLRLVCACALSAPSKSDLQQADIVHVASRSVQAAIGELIPSMPWIVQAPVFLVVCGNGRRLPRISDWRGERFANDHLDAFFNATVDASLLLAHLLVAAEAVGLGTCPISVIRDHAEVVSDLLGLPERVFPVAGLCLGWPAEERALSARLPLALTFHRDRFDDRDLEEEIERYERRRGALDGFDPDSTGFVGWSTQKARMYATPQRTEFGAFVRGKGFNLA
jgi:nitroreductase/FMN reductase [NAD(P)H]